jgi:hypothetical protein
MRVKKWRWRADSNHVTERCPRCAALVQASSLWCGLCHFDLRPTPAPEPEPAVVPAVPVLVPTAGGHEEPAAAVPGRGRHARRTESDAVAPTDSSTVPAEPGFGVVRPRDPNAPSIVDSVDFSVLAGGGGAPMDAGTAKASQWGSRLTTTGAKAAVMAAVVIAVAIVGVVGMTVVSLIVR